MHRRPTHRLSPALLDQDYAAVHALRQVEGYASHNPECSPEGLDRLETQAVMARREEQRLTQALTAARDAAYEAEWALHDAVLAAKGQALVLFGRDASVLDALGLKKRSAYRRPSRKSRVVEE